MINKFGAVLKLGVFCFASLGVASPLRAAETGEAISDSVSLSRIMRIDSTHSDFITVAFDQYAWADYSKANAYARQLEAVALVTFGTRINAIRKMKLVTLYPLGAKQPRYRPSLEVELPKNTAAGAELNAFNETWSKVIPLPFGFEYERVEGKPLWVFKINPEGIGYTNDGDKKNPWPALKDFRRRVLNVLVNFFPTLDIPQPEFEFAENSQKKKYGFLKFDLEVFRSDVGFSPILVFANYLRLIQGLATKSIHAECIDALKVIPARSIPPELVLNRTDPL